MNIRHLLLCLCLPAAAVRGYAQSGACGTLGIYINFDDYVNYDRSTAGDLEVGTAGYLQIGPSGSYDIYGAVLNNGIIQVDSGGVLSVYGDMQNNNTFRIHKDATVHFYGSNWTNAGSAAVSDGELVVNTTPGGVLNFTASRPLVPAGWITLTACLSSYSGGSALQMADGNNVPMDVEMRLNNPNNVLLINSPMRIEGKLQWSVANGNIVLGDQDLVFTPNATQDGFGPDRFAITPGTGHVVKENYTGNWIFPVGIAAGDYTPAAINNSVANTMHVQVQDYASSASDEALSGASADGMDRTWNIYADLAVGAAVINLQHNSITNQPAYNDAFNFVTRWGTTIPNTTGDFVIPYTSSAWQTNNGSAGTTGNLSSTGTVAGSSMQSRAYTDFATTSTAATAFFTKSSDPFHPLPVQLISFSASGQGCSVLLRFKTGGEHSISKYQLQTSTEGSSFSTIAVINPKGSNSDYSFVHHNPIGGRNIYRLIMVQPNGDYTRSQSLVVHVDCQQTKPVLTLFPNPASDIITIAGMPAPAQIRIFNVHGQIVLTQATLSGSEMIDVSQLPAALYTAQVVYSGTEVTNLKFEKL